MNSFIVYTNETNIHELKDLKTTLFRIKGVTAITPVERPFDIYAVRAACEQKVAELIINAIQET